MILGDDHDLLLVVADMMRDYVLVMKGKPVQMNAESLQERWRYGPMMYSFTGSMASKRICTAP